MHDHHHQVYSKCNLDTEIYIPSERSKELGTGFMENRGVLQNILTTTIVTIMVTSTLLRKQGRKNSTEATTVDEG